MVVVPPAIEALVPMKKSSGETIPWNEISKWVCGSIPPGITNFPLASMILVFSGILNSEERPMNLQTYIVFSMSLFLKHLLDKTIFYVNIGIDYVTSVDDPTVLDVDFGVLRHCLKMKRT